MMKKYVISILMTLVLATSIAALPFGCFPQGTTYAEEGFDNTADLNSLESQSELGSTSQEVPADGMGTTEAPFFCSTEKSLEAEKLDANSFLGRYFESGNLSIRTDRDAIDYYMSAEEVDALYDDGKEVLLVSEHGYYLGEVIDENTTRVTTLLETPYSIRTSDYGYTVASVYRNERGYWIYGLIPDYYPALVYLDLVDNRYYYLNMFDYTGWLSFNDRYFAYHPKDGSWLNVIDRDTGSAQILQCNGITYIPYFDEAGNAVIVKNSTGTYNDIDYDINFYKNNTFTYYSWGSACGWYVNYAPNDHIVYVDPDSIMVEQEFSFVKITENGESWSISKKDIIQNNNSAMYSIQTGRVWQFGNGSSYYHSYWVPKEEKIMINESSQKFPQMSLQGYSGRYSDFYDYHMVGSLDHLAVLDQMTYTVYNLNFMHRNREYNQNQAVLNRPLNKDMGGEYGIFDFISNSYHQRSLTCDTPTQNTSIQQGGSLTFSPDAQIGGESNPEEENQDNTGADNSEAELPAADIIYDDGAETETETYTFAYTAGDVYMREGPGKGFDTMSSIPAGSTVDYLGEVSIDERGVAWYYIRYAGSEGWASSRYVVLNANQQFYNENSEEQFSTDWNSIYTVVTSQGSTNPDEGMQISDDMIGKVLQVKDQVGGWFRMIAPESGDYVFSVLAPNLSNGSFSIEVSISGEHIESMLFNESDNIQSSVIKGVEEGQVITWWDNDNSGRYWTLLDPFKLMITVQ